MNIYFICIKVKLPETQPSNIGPIAGGIGSVVVAIVLVVIPQVIKFTSCLPMVGGSLRVLRLPPPLKLVTMI
jgi:hypothetical protein